MSKKKHGIEFTEAVGETKEIFPEEVKEEVVETPEEAEFGVVETEKETLINDAPIVITPEGKEKIEEIKDRIDENREVEQVESSIPYPTTTSDETDAEIPVGAAFKPEDFTEDNLSNKYYVQLNTRELEDNKRTVYEERLDKANVDWIVTATGIILVGPFDTKEDALDSRKKILRKGLRGVIVYDYFKQEAVK